MHPARLRIAVFLECLPLSGGGFQQAWSTVHALANAERLGHDVVVFTPHDETRRFLEQRGVPAVLYRRGVRRLLDRWSGTVAGGAILRRLRRLGIRNVGRSLDAMLERHGIAVAFLTECAEAALRIGDHPIIVTVWDVDHRDMQEFPEAYHDRTFENRERVLSRVLPRAMGVAASSPSDADRLHALYQVARDRLIVLPFLPSLGVRAHAEGRGSTTAALVRAKYRLPDRFVFFPAFMMPQKNHLYVMEALADLERRHGHRVDAVFCGGDTPPTNRSFVVGQVNALNLQDRVRVLPVVPDEEIPALYEAALALTWPTHSRQTHLPPVEAAALRCPVICSDLPGSREQMGDAALYCDLGDVRSMSDHLASLINDPAVAARLRAAGDRLNASLSGVDYAARLRPTLDRYASLRRIWTWPPAL